MRSEILFKLLAMVIISAAIALTAGCDEEEDNPTGGDWQSVTIVVLENNTDKRIAGAEIVIDGKDTCYTSGPGGSSGGECTFALSRTQHPITIFKTGYSRLTDTFLVTSSMSYKYFSLFNY